MPSQRLRPMLDFSMEDTDMVLDSDTPVLDMPDTVMDSATPVLDTDTPVLDMLDMAMLLPMLVLATDTVLDTTAKDPLMPNPKLRLMLVFSMEDTDMVLDP